MMKTMAEQLTQYARYHRDPRNIATHFVGIPMIVLAVAVLLSRPAFEVMGFVVSPVTFVVVATILYYLALDKVMGFVMGVLMVLCAQFGANIAAESTATWLTWGIGLFVVGWIIQFIGHYFEGKKPAFVDDLIGLIIGPLFVTVELLFMFGLLKSLKAEIERDAGPVAIQDKKASA